MTANTIIQIRATSLVDRYVLVTFGDAVISGYLISHDDTTLTVSHVDHRGITTGTTVLAYDDVITLVDFYDDFYDDFDNTDDTDD